MSTISQAPKVNTARTLNIRNVYLLVIAALVLVIAVIVANAAAPAAQPVDRTAYMLYRQGEWHSVPSVADNAEAYQIFRQSEVTSPLSNAEAYHLFRQGEWASVNAPEASVVDLTAYHLSERTLVNPFAQYLASERTLVGIPVTDQTGMSQYHQSERTLLPIANIDPFAAYRQSERTLLNPMAGMLIYLHSERTIIPVTFTTYQLSEWFGE